MKAQVQKIQGRNKITLNTESKLAIGKTYQQISNFIIFPTRNVCLKWKVI